YTPFYWYPSWWTVGPVIGFATAAAFVGPALWYRYNWGYRGYGAIQTNTALYSRFNRFNVTGGAQFQNWRFDAAHRANVPFKNTNLQRQFGNVGTRGVQGVQTGQGQIEQQRQQQQQQQKRQQQHQQQTQGHQQMQQQQQQQQRQQQMQQQQRQQQQQQQQQQRQQQQQQQQQQRQQQQQQQQRQQQMQQQMQQQRQQQQQQQ